MTWRFSIAEITEVAEMIRYRSLDVRSVTLSIDASLCASPRPNEVVDCLRDLVESHGRRIRRAVDTVAARLGVPITTVRIALTPFETVLAPVAAAHGVGKAADTGVEVAVEIDKTVTRVGVDYIGGFAAFADRGLSAGGRAVVEALPRVLVETERVMGFVNAASTQLGLNMDAVAASAQLILDATRRADSPLPGAKFLVTVNVAPDIPFLPAAHHGLGEADGVVNVAISGPSVVAAVLQGMPRDAPLERLYEELKRIGFKVARFGQLVAERVAAASGYRIGSVDLSLAPTPEPGDSIADILEAMGVEFGAPGSIAALAMLIDALRKGGAMGVCCAGGYSGAMIPVSEDSGIAAAVARGLVTIYKLIAMTGVCSTGLDMVPVPGDVDWRKLAGLIADVLVLGMVQDKILGVRLLPAPGKKPGDTIELGGLLGEAPVMDPGPGRMEKFIERGGRIPAPLRRLLAG
ncbi:hypothetical protein Pyrde_1498 [Pyrodictium delaneyi]|uniref:PFL family protein n=1 Tax=Pyrodictium delaneyi TaxID=1273541 RepID=A0A0P0N5H1_9CREN|nr:DUF711 family protein [Pyrodictium delaneyi]ALL01541.1 hypothetical protein Pyrde_1498 [Pyrodictium delaneyi]OWJ54557.1 hypothetical protein Pdsh_05875 [Pyrodictium delaneyi]